MPNLIAMTFTPISLQIITAGSPCSKSAEEVEHFKLQIFCPDFHIIFSFVPHRSPAYASTTYFMC